MIRMGCVSYLQFFLTLPLNNLFVTQADNEDYYCGKSFTEVREHCLLPCSSGDDSECSNVLGPDYVCFFFTGCAEKIANGFVPSLPTVSPTVPRIITMSPAPSGAFETWLPTFMPTDSQWWIEASTAQPAAYNLPVTVNPTLSSSTLVTSSPMEAAAVITNPTLPLTPETTHPISEHIEEAVTASPLSSISPFPHSEPATSRPTAAASVAFPGPTTSPLSLPTSMVSSSPTSWPMAAAAVTTNPTLPSTPETTHSISEHIEESVTASPLSSISPFPHSETTSSRPTAAASVAFQGPTASPISLPTSMVSIQEQSNNGDDAFCGTNYFHAVEECPLACPKGKDDECTNALGEGHKCFVFTGCKHKLANELESVEVTSSPIQKPSAAPSSSSLLSECEAYIVLTLRNTADRTMSKEEEEELINELHKFFSYWRYFKGKWEWSADKIEVWHQQQVEWSEEEKQRQMQEGDIAFQELVSSSLTLVIHAWFEGDFTESDIGEAIAELFETKQDELISALQGQNEFPYFLLVDKIQARAVDKITKSPVATTASPVASPKSATSVGGQTGDTSNGPNGAVIGGAVAGTTLVCILGILLAYFLVQKPRNTKESSKRTLNADDEDEAEKLNPLTENGNSLTLPFGFADKLIDFDLEEDGSSSDRDSSSESASVAKNEKKKNVSVAVDNDCVEEEARSTGSASKKSSQSSKSSTSSSSESSSSGSVPKPQPLPVMDKPSVLERQNSLSSSSSSSSSISSSSSLEAKLRDKIDKRREARRQVIPSEQKDSIKKKNVAKREAAEKSNVVSSREDRVLSRKSSKKRLSTGSQPVQEDHHRQPRRRSTRDMRGLDNLAYSQSNRHRRKGNSTSISKSSGTGEKSHSSYSKASESTTDIDGSLNASIKNRRRSRHQSARSSMNAGRQTSVELGDRRKDRLRRVESDSVIECTEVSSGQNTYDPHKLNKLRCDHSTRRKSDPYDGVKRSTVRRVSKDRGESVRGSMNAGENTSEIPQDGSRRHRSRRSESKFVHDNEDVLPTRNSLERSIKGESVDINRNSRRPRRRCSVNGLEESDKLSERKRRDTGNSKRHQSIRQSRSNSELRLSAKVRAPGDAKRSSMRIAHELQNTENLRQSATFKRRASDQMVRSSIALIETADDNKPRRRSADTKVTSSAIERGRKYEIC